MGSVPVRALSAGKLLASRFDKPGGEGEYNTVAGASPDFVPQVKSGWYGNDTGLAVQNVGANSATVNVTFYDRDSAQTDPFLASFPVLGYPHRYDRSPQTTRRAG